MRINEIYAWSLMSNSWLTVFLLIFFEKGSTDRTFTEPILYLFYKTPPPKLLMITIFFIPSITCWWAEFNCTMLGMSSVQALLLLLWASDCQHDFYIDHGWPCSSKLYRNFSFNCFIIFIKVVRQWWDSVTLKDLHCSCWRNKIEDSQVKEFQTHREFVPI